MCEDDAVKFLIAYPDSSDYRDTYYRVHELL